MNKKKIVSIILGATMLTSSMTGITSATAVISFIITTTSIYKVWFLIISVLRKVCFLLIDIPTFTTMCLWVYFYFALF